jgi:hypothetical protein
MIKSIKIAIYTLILLGVIHLAFTFVLYNNLDNNSIWFFGTGLMYIFMGLYNLAAIKVQFKSISYMAVILNFIGTVFTIAITYILGEPQAFVALVLVIYIFLGSLKLLKY